MGACRGPFLPIFFPFRDVFCSIVFFLLFFLARAEDFRSGDR